MPVRSLVCCWFVVAGLPGVLLAQNARTAVEPRAADPVAPPAKPTRSTPAAWGGMLFERTQDERMRTRWATAADVRRSLILADAAEAHGFGGLELIRLRAEAAEALSDAPRAASLWRTWAEQTGDELAWVRAADWELRTQPPGEIKLSIDLQTVPPKAASAIKMIQYGRLASAGIRRDVQVELELHALRLDPTNPLALLARFSRAGDRSDRYARVLHALDLLKINPMQARLAVDLAQELDRLSLHKLAWTWYEHALAIHRRAAGRTPVPSDDQYAYARSLYDGREPERAAAVLERLLDQDPTHVEARLLLSHCCLKALRPDLAQQHIAYLSQLFRQTKPSNGDDFARRAWLYTLYEPDPQVALQLARDALSRDPQGRLPRLAYGFASLLNKEYIQAKAALMDLADSDQMAAYGLARAHMRLGDTEAAQRTLRKAADLQRSGLAYQQLQDLASELGIELPPPGQHEDIRDALNAFPESYRTIGVDPATALELTLEPTGGAVALDRPMAVSIVLRNKSDVPIRLGPHGLANPIVGVSAAVYADRPRQADHVQRVDLLARTVLAPGEAVRGPVRLDIGPVADWLGAMPTREVQIRVSLVLDPIMDPAGQPRIAANSIVTSAFTYVRPAAKVDAGRVAQLSERLARSDWPAVSQAAELAVGVLLERRLFELKRLSGTGPEIDATALRQQILGLLADGSSLQRVAVLRIADRLPLGDDVLQAASRCLNDVEPVVRLLMVHTLGRRQPDAARALLRSLATRDPDPLVRSLAGSYAGGS